MKFLVTGAAGFIGYHVAERLLTAGHQVVGIDNLNDYYDVGLKMARLDRLADKPGFRFIKLDLADREGMAALFAEHQFQRVIHLGAQAGVRYSLVNPLAYADANLIGHLNVLEGCRHNKVEHLLYASSSSVYGLNRKLPFATEDSVDHPVSLYAATKKSQRADVTQLFPFIRSPDDRTAVLYGIWSLGAPGYGAVQVYQSHIGRGEHRRI